MKIYKIGFLDVFGFNCYFGRNEVCVIIRKLYNMEMFILGSFVVVVFFVKCLVEGLLYLF